MSSIYLSRQPIVSLDGSLEAYAVMSRDFNEENISVISSMSNGKKAFLKIDTNFLMSDSILEISSDIFILSLLQSIEINEKTTERIEVLAEKGFSIAVHNVDLNENNILNHATIIDKLTYFKININMELGASEKELLVFLQKQNIKVLATKIETLEEYKKAQELECDLYEGYWFEKSNVSKKTGADLSEFKVLSLYNTILNSKSMDEITLAFEQNENLSSEFLQFINSANFNLTREVTSVEDVLTLVGKKMLSIWLILMAYSKSNSENNNISSLVLMAKNRTELMQKILKALKPDVNNNALSEAYLIGAISLVDTVFDAELSDILDYMNISEVSKQAILNDAGALGKIYKLVRDIEEYNVAEIDTFATSYNVQEKTIEEVILKSIEDVNAFETSLTAS